MLASASARRRELLLQAGFEFRICAADVDETALPGEDAVTLATRLALLKAEAVLRVVQPATARDGEIANAAESQEMLDTATAWPRHPVVLGADTVVLAPSGELLGKPADAEDAARMLRLLSGATHQVVTGVCACSAERCELAAAVTYVTFLTLSETDIAEYIVSGEPDGKAGAYAIQGRAARWVPRIQGDYSNVVGLPLALATEMLKGFSIKPG